MAGTISKLGWKVFGFSVGVGAAVISREVFVAAWKFVTGKPPPDAPDNPDTGTFQAVTWVIASGVGGGVARLLATRKAPQVWLKATGQLPPWMQEIDT
jgi:Protein of unknown function (DUF4235)